MDKEDGDTTTTNADTFHTDALKSCRPAPTPRGSARRRRVALGDRGVTRVGLWLS